jgi:hypothetical protein
MKKCIECQAFDVRSFPEHTKQGQASCNATMEFFPIEQEIECKDYAPAQQQAIINRRKWRDS